MKRLFLMAVIVLAFGVGSAAAQVICPTAPPCFDGQPCPMVPDCQPPVQPGVFTNPEWLKVAYHRVNVEIDGQIARTDVDMLFVNEGGGLAEGTFVFPLPQGAAVEQLVMYINDTPIEARILPADEARAYYDEIVRQFRDPALLEYLGTQAVQANIFPIPPGETRRITITYSQALAVDNGLVHYVYPLDVTRLTSRRPVEQTSISISAVANSEIRNIYSPSHSISISRNSDGRGFRVGFEAALYAPTQDFSLYYGVTTGNEISIDLLTYRESANEDGFFMLMVQPPLSLPSERVAPQDIVLVVDQSGSMDGAKWTQAQAAATYVLKNLNPADRFNVILFSTGWRLYSSQLEPGAQTDSAIDWVNSQAAEGGTDINGALMTALGFADAERPLTVLFITDGLATEGETNPQTILANIDAAAAENARIFTFGVGDDVDTFLLDSIARGHRGSGSYVRPTERIDEEVASLYNQISSPVMTDVELTIEGVTADSWYPALPLPDLFVGNQLIIVGRYRNSADAATIRLSGIVGGERQTLVYENLTFGGRAGGESFIARLWATRRIGDLLNRIRLNGENQELVNSIVSLSVRYGVITPYTSFLIDENDILTQAGRTAAAENLAFDQHSMRATSGGAAVDAADTFSSMEQAAVPQMAPMPTMMADGGMLPMPGVNTAPANPIQTVGDKTFIWRDGVWTDTTFAPDTMTTQKIVFLSDAYFDLLAANGSLGEYFALGERVIVVLEGVAYEVVTE
jgi:Ca-activated chloride channel family protein